MPNIFITDFRYKEQAEKEVHEWAFFIKKEDVVKVKNLSRKTGINNLGIESSVSYDVFTALCRDINLKAVKSLIERLRQMKDIHEISSIREAIRRAESAFLDVKPYIRRGVRERSLALRLEDGLKKKSCGHLPFDVIVASGPNSAMPHSKPTERKFTKGDLIIIDWGGEADGYFSDMTRTLLIDKGNNISQKKKIYRIVLEANKRATKLVAPGTELQQIDGSETDFIKIFCTDHTKCFAFDFKERASRGFTGLFEHFSPFKEVICHDFIFFTYRHTFTVDLIFNLYMSVLRINYRYT